MKIIRYIYSHKKWQIGNYRLLLAFSNDTINFLPRMSLHYYRKGEQCLSMGWMFFSLTIFNYTNEIHK